MGEKSYHKDSETNCLEKWLGKLKDPWALGCFEAENILEKVIQLCEEYKQKYKPRGEKKTSAFAHAMWHATLTYHKTHSLLKKEYDGAKEQWRKEKEEKEEKIKGLESRVEDLKRELETRVESFRRDWESQLSQKDTQIAQKDARIDDLARQLQHYANEHAIYTMERTKLGQEYAEVHKLKQENKTLKEDLAQTRGLLVRLMAEAKEQKQAISHVQCQNQIQQLKEALNSHKAAIAAVYGEDILEPQQTVPQDAVPEAPFNPSWETQCPVNPVTTRHIVANNNVTDEVVIAPWKPSELEIVAKELGPLTRNNCTDWMFKVYRRYPLLSGTDLTPLAQRCAKGPDGAALEGLAAGQNLHNLNMMSWMRLVFCTLKPGTSLRTIYYSTVQYENESPDAFLERKKLLAILANIVDQRGDGEYDFDRPEFASAVYESLNIPTKLRLGLVNNAHLAYPELHLKLIQASELMRATGTGCSQKEVPEVPIHAVTFSNYGPHSQYQYNNQNWKENRNRRFNSFHSHHKGNRVNDLSHPKEENKIAEFEESLKQHFSEIPKEDLEKSKAELIELIIRHTSKSSEPAAVVQQTESYGPSPAIPVMHIISSSSKPPSSKHQVYLTVNGKHTCAQVDSGSKLTSVHKSLVKPSQFLPGQAYKVKPYESKEIFVPKARVQLEYRGWKGLKVVAVHSDTPTPVLLGENFCEFIDKQNTTATNNNNECPEVRSPVQPRYRKNSLSGRFLYYCKSSKE